MADRLTDAFNMLRQGGAIFAGRARLTNWSDNARGMNASFRLDASADPLDNPATNPFKGAHCSPKDGHEFMVLVIPVANAEPEEEPQANRQTSVDSSPPPAEPRQTTNANRAGMMIREPLFWRYLVDQHHYPASTVSEADSALKDIVGVRSKTELNADSDATVRFDRLYRDFWRWKNEPVA